MELQLKLKKLVGKIMFVQVIILHFFSLESTTNQHNF